MTQRIHISNVEDPNTWEPCGFKFESPEEALRFAQAFSKELKNAFEQGYLAGLEEAAKIAVKTKTPGVSQWNKACEFIDIQIRSKIEGEK